MPRRLTPPESGCAEWCASRGYDCPECEGSGRLKHEMGTCRRIPAERGYRFMRCDNCLGTGKIKGRCDCGPEWRDG